VVALLWGTLAGAADAPPSARAFMTGDQASPAVDSAGLGYAIFTLNADQTACHFKVVVADLSDITAAHIHVGKMGVEGPPVVNLFTGPAKTGRFDGVLGEGDFDATDLMGPLQGKTMKDLLTLARQRGLYVNVHTTAHPEGEIRGQIWLTASMYAAPLPALAPGQARCPVMGTVMPQKEMIPYTYQGTTYYMCCKPCLDLFKANPTAYIPVPPPEAGSEELPW
jgi:YHS domain-containing protein